MGNLQGRGHEVIIGEAQDCNGFVAHEQACKASTMPLLINKQKKKLPVIKTRSEEAKPEEQTES